MNIITAINNEKIIKELKREKNIKIISKDIQYKEGILEMLEKNNNIQYILINENLNGQIKIEELINKIKKINSKINIIIILNKKDNIKEEYLLQNKTNFIYKEELLLENILELLFNKNKIISIIGSAGNGKTITTIILSEILIKYKNKKILIVEDNIKNNSILKIYKKENAENNKINNNNVQINNKKTNDDKTIKIKNNLYLFNIKNISNNYKKDKIKIINQINKIKNNYDYIFIDMQNLNSIKIYEKIITDNILILNSNILEINKIKNYIINNNLISLKIILNNYNENSISEKILINIFNNKNKFNNKIKIIEKIENNKNYNLIINNNLNIKYLDKKTKNKYLNIINNI